jgi:hypothetical protein
MDLFTIAPFIFVASITAAGLVYTAGMIIATNPDFKIQWSYNWSRVKKGEFEKLDLMPYKLLTNLNAIIFLITNFIILISWIFDNDVILDVALCTYSIGLILMIFTIYKIIEFYHIHNVHLKTLGK